MTSSGLSFLANLSRPAFVAMVHVHALPGTPRHREGIRAVIEHAVGEAKLLADHGADALLLENMHDLPYLNRRVGPEIVAAMTAVACAVRQAVALPMGMQVLAGANAEALSIAHSTGLQFVRAEGFVFSHVADEGLMSEADAGPLLRFRRSIGAEHVAIIADVKKKHSSHAITADIDLAESARAAIFAGADGIVVTGTATGVPTQPEDVAAVADAVDEPVFVGSGVTPERISALAPHADALIVGSYLKKDGHWAGDLDSARIAKLVSALTGS